ncbi:peptidyl-prolyl cis-trans isomerase [Pseudomonadota bacterium]
MSRGTPLTHQILREPLIHFLLIAILLFLIDSSFSSIRSENIVVDKQTAKYLIEQRENLELRPLTLEEKQETIDSFVDDEILYAEAYRRGLDRGDSRMRRNLILKMRGLLTDEVGPPTETQLREYFESRRTEYMYPANWSIQQVIYNGPSQIPDALLEKLNSGLDASALGEYRPGMGRTIKRMSKKDIAANFGPKAALFILNINDDRWHGPVESIHGIHFIRIISRVPARDADFEHIRNYLKTDWMLAQSRLIVQQETKRLRKNYNIVVETGDELIRASNK